MYQPQSYAVALTFLIVTMLCWGSWANTLKLAPRYRFQLFYWDYAVGLILGSLVLGLTLGSHGTAGTRFLDDLLPSRPSNIGLAVLGGAIFNIANLLLVAAIDVAGLAVAFPVGIGLALIVGAVSSFLLAPKGNPWLLFVGVALVVAAIVCDAAAYRVREAVKQAASKRGIFLSLAAGLLMGTFYPFVSKAMSGRGAPGPYATSYFFVSGVFLCALPVNALLMRFPLDGKPRVDFSGYLQAKSSWHLAGILGGIVWCVGATLNFVASRASIVGPAVSYSIGQGATMISAAWGVFIWREFAGSPPLAKRLLWLMFALFLLGLTLIAVAPLYKSR